MQKHIICCRKHYFAKILLTNCKCKSIIWIYTWSRWATHWKPAEFRHVGSLRSNISKKYFCPGGMAPSEWMRSVRAIRDTPVADNSAPGLNTTCRVAYRPPIAIAPFLLAPLVSYFKWTLWRWTPIVTICWNRFIGHALASASKCDGWCCENHYTRSFY
jgi:hypothetical protein